jgi:hypothetical protein
MPQPPVPAWVRVLHVPTVGLPWVWQACRLQEHEGQLKAVIRVADSSTDVKFMFVKTKHTIHTTNYVSLKTIRLIKPVYY